MKNPKEGAGQKPAINIIPWQTRLRPYLIVAPALIITIGILIPFIMAIYFSMTSYSFRMPTYSFVWFKNWINIISDGNFWRALWVTLVYAFFSTAIELLLGLGIALLLNDVSNRFSKILRVVLVFPLMIAPVTATIVWQLMLNNSVGIVEKFLNLFGV